MLIEARISALEVPQGIHYEGMHYDKEQQRLVWVDILGKTLCLYDLQTQIFSNYTLPEMIGFAFPQGKNLFLCGLETGLAVYDITTDSLTPLGNPEPQYPNSRLNDGKLDALGRVWASTMDIEAKEPVGHLYCCKLNGSKQASYTAVDQGFTIGNGPAWSPDGKVFYHAETCKGAIMAFDFDLARGEITNKQLFYQHNEEGVLPDGMQTDSSGNLWIAMAHGGKVIRLSPKGKLTGEIELPTVFPTSLSFVNEAEDRIYVTSSQLDQVEGDHLAGSILRVDF